MNVYVETRTVGQGFGTVGVVRAVGSGRKLAESDTVRPYGFVDAASRDAEQLAVRRGWQVVDLVRPSPTHRVLESKRRADGLIEMRVREID